MNLPFFSCIIQTPSLCRFAVIKQEVELTPQSFTYTDAEVSPLVLVPCLFSLNLQKISVFETSLHHLSGCWELGRQAERI